MSWLKKLFGLEKEEPTTPVESPEKPLEALPQEVYNHKVEECFDCKKPIEVYQKIRHWGGKSYHKMCLRKLIKKAKQSI